MQIGAMGYIIALIALCIGSLLNVIAYRLLHSQRSLFARSACPHCHHILSWLDLVPIASWLLLRGTCRYCHKPISWLYPAIEILTTISIAMLWYTQSNYFLLYSFFFCALLLTVRTDIESFLILRTASLYFVPIGIALSLLHLLPLGWQASFLGALLGYGSLWLMRYVFWYIRDQEGLGMGDVELLAAIGAFTGPFGCWMILTIATCAGSILGLFMILWQGKNKNTLQIPLGALLALSAIGYILTN